ncbi:hypothetical protein HPB50_027896 [Hyalomma asiaticum]|nr:hypothetical protein HPB50_027896 [Hyalomma asiaticum]
MPSLKHIGAETRDYETGTYERLPTNSTRMGHLKSKQMSQRTHNTRIINEVSALLANDSATYDQLSCMNERLKANNNELRSMNNEIEQHIPDNKLESRYNAVIAYEDNAIYILAELLSEKSQTAVVYSGARNVAAPRDGTGVKLPKLTGAPFCGDLCKWTEFWEQFDQIVHSDTHVTATEKLHYLGLYLNGNSAE